MVAYVATMEVAENFNAPAAREPGLRRELGGVPFVLAPEGTKFLIPAQEGVAPAQQFESIRGVLGKLGRHFEEAPGKDGLTVFRVDMNRPREGMSSPHNPDPDPIFLDLHLYNPCSPPSFSL